MKKILIIISVIIVLAIAVMAMSSNSEVKDSFNKGVNDGKNAAQQNK